MILDPCVLCRGSGLLRHEQPPELPIEEWRKILQWGKCPLCQGKCQQPYIRLQTGVVPRNVFFWTSKLSGRIYAACQHCNLWADATVFVRRGKAYQPIPVAYCPGGHSIRLDISLAKA